MRNIRLLVIITMMIYGCKSKSTGFISNPVAIVNSKISQYVIINSGFKNDSIIDCIIDSGWTINFSGDNQSIISCTFNSPDTLWSTLQFSNTSEKKQTTQIGAKINTETDTTIILSNGYYGETRTYRFIVRKDHYNEAYSICQLLMIPYNGLNSQAQKELEEGHKINMLSQWRK